MRRLEVLRANAILALTVFVTAGFMTSEASALDLVKPSSAKVKLSKKIANQDEPKSGCVYTYAETSRKLEPWQELNQED